MSRAQRDLVQTLGREPIPEEVGQRVGLSAEKVEEVLSISRDPLSLETPVSEEEDRLGEFIEDIGAVAPLEAASFGMLRDEIGSVLLTVTRERRVVELRFGLTDGQPRTLEEVGRKFAITQGRAHFDPNRSLPPTGRHRRTTTRGSRPMADCSAPTTSDLRTCSATDATTAGA